MWRRSGIRKLIDTIGPTLRETGFGVELEITAKLARHRGVRFYERPIAYSPRTYDLSEEGGVGPGEGWVEGRALLAGDREDGTSAG